MLYSELVHTAMDLLLIFTGWITDDIVLCPRGGSLSTRLCPDAQMRLKNQGRHVRISRRAPGQQSSPLGEDQDLGIEHHQHHYHHHQKRLNYSGGCQLGHQNEYALGSAYSTVGPHCVWQPLPAQPSQQNPSPPSHEGPSEKGMP